MNNKISLELRAAAVAAEDGVGRTWSPRDYVGESMALNFKSLLKFHRLRNGYKLRQFARLIEEAPSNYANVEAGRRKPWRSKDKLRAIAKALALREGSQEWDRFFIAATVIPPGIDRLLGRPMILALLRAIDELKPSENDLRRLIETLHKGGTQ